jgi:hypothetical protein
MDYAINPHQSTLHSQLSRWLKTPSRVKNSAKWLLLDASLIEQNDFARLQQEHHYVVFNNVFIKSRFEVYGLYAPHLIRLDELQESTQAAFLSDLLNISSGIPALAALDASNDLTSLSECLTWFAQAFTQDDMELYCRLADTRITPGLLQMLDKEQKLALTQNILQWQIVNRLGTLEALLPNIKPQLDDNPTPFKTFTSGKAFTLTDEQFKGLMDRAEADGVFQHLCENNSKLVPVNDRGLFHKRLESIVIRARHNGLEGHPDMLLFSTIALSTHDKFDAHPILKETWLKIKEQRTNLNQVVSEWSDTVWGELSQPPA